MGNFKCANYAFIDNQNLYMAVKDMGWQIDCGRFYSWLRNKYSVTKAFMFIGYIATNEHIYASMKASGFDIIFRPTLHYKDQSTKGNCDAELVMQVMIELADFHQAIIVTGDGDFWSLCGYLIKRNKLQRLLIPNKKKYSALLRAYALYITFLSDDGLRDKLKKRH
jgi:uncharacterized LabA/DUF88 family protein